MVDAQVGMPLVLDAAGTADPDGHALTYTWFFYPEAGTGIPDQPVLVRQRADRGRGRERRRLPLDTRRPARAAAAARDRERRRDRAPSSSRRRPASRT